MAETMTIKNYHNYSYTNREKKVLKRFNQPVRVSNKDITVDSLFQKLEVSKDKNGKIVDTRFSPEVQSYIRSYLRSKNIKYNDTGYLSLRSACYKLRTEDRLQLCININAKYNSGLNIEKEMKGAKSFFNSFKTGAALTVGGAALGTAGGIAMQVANPTLIPNAVGEAGKKLINQTLTDPTVQSKATEAITEVANNYIANDLPSLATGLKDQIPEIVASDAFQSTKQDVLDSLPRIFKIAINKSPNLDTMVTNTATNYLSNEGNISNLSTLAQDVVDPLIKQEMPNIMNEVQNTANQYVDNIVASNTLPVNLVTVGLAGLAAGAVTAATKGLYDIAKSTIKRSKANKTSQSIQELDNALYAQDNIEEARKIESSLAMDGIVTQQRLATR